MTNQKIDETLAKHVLEILQSAGEKIMEVYSQVDFQIEQKADDSPLTIADRRSHELIIEKLAKLTPTIPIVSEEDEVAQDSAPKYWLVDPLDGTKEFIKRNGEFTVMAALMENEHPILGIIHAPYKKIDYYGGVSVRPVKISDGVESNISVSEELHDPIVVVASRSHLDDKSKAFINKLGRHDLTSMGSGFKFGLVAEGKADVYVRFHPTMEWDTAAGQAIVEAAGGKMISVDGSEFPYGKDGRVNGGFVLFNQALDISKYL